MHRVAGRSQVLGDLRLRRRERSGWGDPRSGLSGHVDVPGVRRGHPGEGVEQHEIAIHLAQLLERQRDRHHASAAPDTALDQGARNPVRADVPDRVHERSDALGRRHRVALYGAPDGDLGRRQIRRVRQPLYAVPQQIGGALGKQPLRQIANSHPRSLQERPDCRLIRLPELADRRPDNPTGPRKARHQPRVLVGSAAQQDPSRAVEKRIVLYQVDRVVPAVRA